MSPKTVVFTIRTKPLFRQPQTPQPILSDLLGCCSTPRPQLPGLGSIGIDRTRRFNPLALTACEYGPMAFGACSFGDLFTVAIAIIFVMQTKGGILPENAVEGQSSRKRLP